MNVSVQQRMEASVKLSQSIDKKVRVLSRYGDASVDAFDESMAYAGIAHALATWWEHMSNEQVADRLKNLIQATTAARCNLVAERQAGAASAPASVN